MITCEKRASRRAFFTPERFAQEQAQRMESSRGKLLIAGCSSGAYLSTQVTATYNQLMAEAGSQDTVLYLPDVDFRFSDTETCARLELHVGGYDVFLFQALLNPITGHSVDENYMAFLIAVRTFRDHGAHHVTAVLPYLAYTRQDKPTKFMREPTTARLMADLSLAAGIGSGGHMGTAQQPDSGLLRPDASGNVGLVNFVRRGVSSLSGA